MDDPLTIIIIPINISMSGMLHGIILLLLIIALAAFIYDSIFLHDLTHMTAWKYPTLAQDVKDIAEKAKKYRLEPPSWNVVRETTETTDTSGRRILKHAFGDYEILEIYDIFTKEECAKMIEFANLNGLEVSEISSYNKNKSKLDTTVRISEQAWVEDSYDPLVQKFADFAAELTGKPVENQEATQVAKYDVGGKFIEHYDACVPDGTSYCNDLDRLSGDRLATLLVYLNDDFEGGKTEFTKLGFSVTPEAGKGILFWNTDANDIILDESEHKGAEILKGTKWISTKWVHHRKFQDS